MVEKKGVGVKLDLPEGIGIKLNLPEEVVAVYEDAARISHVDFNTVITVVLAVFLVSRRATASAAGKPKAAKAERKAKSK
jgi:hypothetical protein